MGRAPAVLEKALRQGGSASVLSHIGLGLGSILLASVLLLITWAWELSWGKSTTNEYISLHKTQGFLGGQGFSREEMDELGAQPGVRALVAVSRADYAVYGTLDLPGMSFGSMLFLEAIPEEHLDEPITWADSNEPVPILIGEGFLYLYNSAFAPANNLPPINPAALGIIPLKLNLVGSGGTMNFKARIVGLTRRMDSILVPLNFIDYTNSLLAGTDGTNKGPTKVMLVLNGREQPALRDWCKSRGYDFVSSSFAGSPLMAWAAGLAGAILLFAVLMLALSVSQALLGLRLSMVLNAEVREALQNWHYPRAFVARAQLGMVWRPLRTLGLALSVLIFTLWILLAIQYQGPGITALSAGIAGTWFAPAVLIFGARKELRV